MTDFQYQRTLMLGVIIGVLFCILGFYMTKPGAQPMTSKNNFKIVDAYEGCSVVQYTNQYLSHYNYFLDCKNTRVTCTDQKNNLVTKPLEALPND
jgi:hypothetical protein